MAKYHRIFKMANFNRNVGFGESYQNGELFESQSENFLKSDQSFLRIELSDKGSAHQKFIRPYDVTMPAKIVIHSIYNFGYKRFQNVTVQTKVGF